MRKVSRGDVMQAKVIYRTMGARMALGRADLWIQWSDDLRSIGMSGRLVVSDSREGILMPLREIRQRAAAMHFNVYSDSRWWLPPVVLGGGK